MATVLQFRGGTTAEHSTFTGAAKEITVDTTLNQLRLHDGVTVGGKLITPKFGELAGEIPVNASLLKLTDVGTAGNQIPTNADLDGKNLFINGGFDIWQRGETFTDNGYTADRWGLFKAAGVMTLTKSDVTPNILGDGRLRLETTTIDVDAQIYQKIENVRTLQGKTATLSFWVYTSDNFQVQAKHSFGTGSATTQRIFHDAVTTGVIAATWSKVTMEITVPELLVTDDVNADNFLQVTLFIGANLGNTYIKDVKLEEGSAATPFSTQGSSIGEELVLCGRYYQKSTYAPVLKQYVTGRKLIDVIFPTTMRAVPSMVINRSGYTSDSLVVAAGGFQDADFTALTASASSITSWTADAEL